jgi:hypothetical protein
MGALGTLLGLPVIGPLAGLGWLARRIAEAVDQEMADPARIEAAIAALERQLESGEIDEATYEEREAVLLIELAALTAPLAQDDAAGGPP